MRKPASVGKTEETLRRFAVHGFSPAEAERELTRFEDTFAEVAAGYKETAQHLADRLIAEPAARLVGMSPVFGMPFTRKSIEASPVIRDVCRTVAKQDMRMEDETWISGQSNELIAQSMTLATVPYRSLLPWPLLRTKLA